MKRPRLQGPRLIHDCEVRQGRPPPGILTRLARVRGPELLRRRRHGERPHAHRCRDTGADPSLRAFCRARALEIPMPRGRRMTRSDSASRRTGISA